MKLSYRIPRAEIPPRLDINRDERGLAITVGRLKEFRSRGHTIGNYVAAIAIVLVANSGVALAMIRSTFGGSGLAELHLLLLSLLVWSGVAVVILLLHDRDNRWTVFNVSSDGLRVATHGPLGVRRQFIRRDRMISIECRKSQDHAPADDWSTWHYLAVTSRHTRSYSGSRIWLSHYPEDLIRKVAEELRQSLSLPAEKVT